MIKSHLLSAKSCFCDQLMWWFLKCRIQWIHTNYSKRYDFGPKITRFPKSRIYGLKNGCWNSVREWHLPLVIGFFISCLQVIEVECLSLIWTLSREIITWVLRSVVKQKKKWVNASSQFWQPCCCPFKNLYIIGS